MHKASFESDLAPYCVSTYGTSLTATTVLQRNGVGGWEGNAFCPSLSHVRNMSSTISTSTTSIGLFVENWPNNVK